MLFKSNITGIWVKFHILNGSVLKSAILPTEEQWTTDKFLAWMYTADNKTEMAQNLEVQKMYLPLQGLHTGKGVCLANGCFGDPEIYRKRH